MSNIYAPQVNMINDAVNKMNELVHQRSSDVNNRSGWVFDGVVFSYSNSAGNYPLFTVTLENFATVVKLMYVAIGAAVCESGTQERFHPCGYLMFKDDVAQSSLMSAEDKAKFNKVAGLIADLQM